MPGSQPQSDSNPGAKPNSKGHDDLTPSEQVDWATLFKADALSERNAALVTVFAATVHSPHMSSAALKAAAARPESGEAILEALFQVPLFAGFPRGINALASFRKEFGDEVGGETKSAGDDLDQHALRERGEKLFRQIYAGNTERVLSDLDRFHPDLAPWILTSAYGGVLTRPELDAAARELCAIAALIVSGDTRQLSSHLRGALNCGASKTESQAAAERARPFVNNEAWLKAQAIVERTLSEYPGSIPDGRPNAS